MLNYVRVSLRVESEMILFEIAPTKASPYSITERRVPEMIPVLGSQPVAVAAKLVNGPWCKKNRWAPYSPREKSH